jgi:uncharacterized protein
MYLVNVIKPTHICNLACTYCYNDDVRDPIMRPEVLERTISESFRYARDHGFDGVQFIWHGGEPMVPGLKFYERIVGLQAKHSGGLPMRNSIQTNGTLINEHWIEFLKKNDYSVSISIDGPKEMHDQARVDHRGNGSFDRVLRAIRMVKGANLGLGVIFVVTKANISKLEEIYDFIAKEKLPFQIVPITKSGSARDTYGEIGLQPEEYGDAWIKVYDKWLIADDSYVYCQDFALKTQAIHQGFPADCVGLSSCISTNISADPMGDIYPCATLSGHEMNKFGNIMESSLDEIMLSRVAVDYRAREVDPYCSTCKWQHVCHGGCLARSQKFFGNHHRRDYYCPSLFKIYEHIEMRLKERGIARGAPKADPLFIAAGLKGGEIDRLKATRKGTKRYIPIVQS